MAVATYLFDSRVLVLKASARIKHLLTQPESSSILTGFLIFLEEGIHV